MFFVVLIFGGWYWIFVVLVLKSRVLLEGCIVNVVDSMLVIFGLYMEIWYIREVIDRCLLINRVCGRFWMIGVVFKVIEKINILFIYMYM